MISTSLLLLPLLATADPGPKGYVLDVREAKRIEGSLTFGVRQDTAKASEWILFVAQAPELPRQAKVRTQTDPKTEAMTVAQGDLKRTVLRARVPAKTPEWQTGYEMKVTYEMTLMARKLRPLGADEPTPKVTDLSASERKAYLAPLGDLNHEAPLFRDWLRESKMTREKDESEIDFARRVFLGIRGTVKYEIRPEMDRSALGVCKAGKGDCGGLSA